MNDYIERYVYAVTKRLPEKNREEVGKELMSMIWDMLPEQPTDEQIEKVLYDLGDPRVLASNYQEKKHYLISPVWFEDYIRVLKIVLIVVGSVSLIFGLYGALIEAAGANPIEAFAEAFAAAISGFFDGMFQAFAWVTFIFALIDWFDKSPKKAAWKVQDLSKMPKETSVYFSKRKTIVSLIITAIVGTIMLYFVYNNQFYFFYWENLHSDAPTIFASVFTDVATRRYFAFMLVSFAFDIIIHVMKLYYGRYNVKFAAEFTIQKVFAFIVTLLFVMQADLLNPMFVDEMVSKFSANPARFEEGFHAVMIAIAALTGLGIATEIIKTWILSLRSDGVRTPSIKEKLEQMK